MIEQVTTWPEPASPANVMQFGQTVCVSFGRLSLMWTDPDEARQALSEALSKVVPLCMTDAQRIEDEL